MSRCTVMQHFTPLKALKTCFLRQLLCDAWRLFHMTDFCICVFFWALITSFKCFKTCLLKSHCSGSYLLPLKEIFSYWLACSPNMNTLTFFLLFLLCSQKLTEKWDQHANALITWSVSWLQLLLKNKINTIDIMRLLMYAGSQNDS